MKWLLPFLLVPLLPGANPELLKVKSVYLLPMANGMDQYLANALQASNLYVVVTDPASADAIFTDSIGPAFERKWKEIYPPQEVPQETAEKTEKKDEEQAEEKAAEKAEEARDNQGSAVPLSSFRRGRGVVFLVERRSKQVVWSTFAPNKDVRPATIDKTAQAIASRLKKDLAGK